MKKLKQFIQSINLQGVTVGTIVRTVMLIISIVIFILKAFGVEIPVIEENTVTDIIIALFGLVSFLQAYWKNNSITKAAQEADKIMQEKKGEV